MDASGGCLHGIDLLVDVVGPLLTAVAFIRRRAHDGIHTLGERFLHEVDFVAAQFRVGAVATVEAHIPEAEHLPFLVGVVGSQDLDPVSRGEFTHGTDHFPEATDVAQVSSTFVLGQQVLGAEPRALLLVVVVIAHTGHVAPRTILPAFDGCVPRGEALVEALRCGIRPAVVMIAVHCVCRHREHVKSGVRTRFAGMLMYTS